MSQPRLPVRPALFLLFSFLFLCLPLHACTDTQDVWVRPVVVQDPFQVWKEGIASFLGTCLGPDPASYKGCNRVARECLAEALNLFDPPLPYDNPAQQFQTEMWAGRVFLSIEQPRVSDLMYDCLGMDSGMFSGSGHPIPWAATPDGMNYAMDRGREYVTPNMEETQDHLWTWELSPTEEHLDLKIGEIIQDPDLPPLAGADALRAELPDLLKKLADPEEPLPPVTRLTITAYHGAFPGKVAAPARVRAFFFDFRDGTNMSLRQAARASGFDLHEPDPIGENKLYFWLFNPKSPEEITRITWGSVFRNLPEWLGQ
jgi:hypothetical protein